MHLLADFGVEFAFFVICFEVSLLLPDAWTVMEKRRYSSTAANSTVSSCLLHNHYNMLHNAVIGAFLLQFLHFFPRPGSIIYSYSLFL